MVRSFEDMWAVTDTIFGAFTQDEARTLYTSAVEMGEKKNFVEIGCYMGRSTSLLSMIAKDNQCDFTTIDIFITTPEGVSDPKAEFIKNMQAVDGNYTLMNMESEEAAGIYKQKVDLIFIDGDHQDFMVQKDIDLWQPKMNKGGLMLFHDYGSSWVGVGKAVDAMKDVLFRGYTESLAVVEIIN